MKIHSARIFVTNMNAARAFYADILDLPVAFERDDAIGFDLGISLIIELVDQDHRILAGRFTGLSLDCTDIHKEYDRLRSLGVTFSGPPEKQSWGGKLAHFDDPSGNTLTLVSA
ncbi:VOC family protein [uncultured Roseovarius sp.]|uniref:VOC family protein n=1 Tax=uncultured Roseovarius sp. TaxID=293344 RepID=UPI002601D333|nr:VOC family protein [uncultured Roseovarius sp.]